MIRIPYHPLVQALVTSWIVGYMPSLNMSSISFSTMVDGAMMILSTVSSFVWSHSLLTTSVSSPATGLLTAELVLLSCLSHAAASFLHGWVKSINDSASPLSHCAMLLPVSLALVQPRDCAPSTMQSVLALYATCCCERCVSFEMDGELWYFFLSSVIPSAKSWTHGKKPN